MIVRSGDCVMCVDYGDYEDDDGDVSHDCVISPLSAIDSDLPVFITAFHSPAQSRDPSACSNSSIGVHVVSVRDVERRNGDVRRRLARIRVNVVNDVTSQSPGASHYSLSIGLTTLMFQTECS